MENDESYVEYNPQDDTDSRSPSTSAWRGFSKVHNSKPASAQCNACKRVLKNTGAKRLHAHRVICPSKPASQDDEDLHMEFAETSEGPRMYYGSYNTNAGPKFSLEEIRRFIETAPDFQYLVHKVTILLAHFGLTSVEMSGLRERDVRFSDYHVEIVVTRTVVITDEQCQLNAVEVLRNYNDLAAVIPGRSAFLIYYGVGQWTSRPLPKSAFSQHPEDVARFLGLKSNKIVRPVRTSSLQRQKETPQPSRIKEEESVWETTSVTLAEADTSEQNKILLQMIEQNQQMFVKMEEVLEQNHMIIEQNQKLIKLLVKAKGPKAMEDHCYEEEQDFLEG